MIAIFLADGYLFSGNVGVIILNLLQLTDVDDI